MATHTCADCDFAGDGNCSVCHGKGKTPGSGISDASNAYGQASSCSACGGSGECQTCGGLGEVEVGGESG